MKTGNWNQKGKLAKTSSLVLKALVPLLSFLGLSGCANNSQEKTPSDPLLGPVPTQQQPGNDPLLQGNPTITSQNQKSPPPIPENTSGISTAAMVNLTPLDDRRDLRIPGTTNPVENSSANATQNNSGWKGSQQTNTKPGAVLKRPEPVSEPKANPNPQPVPTVQNPNNRPTLEQLRKELKRRGVVWAKQEKIQGGVRLSAGVVTDPRNPKMQRVYEASAADAVTAGLAIIRQIDQR